MRVLLVGKGAPEHGGIPVYLASLLASRLASTHELSFLNLARTDGRQQGGRFSGGNVRRTSEDAVAVWRRASGVDLVHLHSAAAPGVTLARAGLLAAVARARGARAVVHVHGGLLAGWMRSRRRRRLAATALAAASAVVTVSEDAERALGRVVRPRRLWRIDNGVDTVRFAPPAPRPTHSRPTVLYVGILTPRKGLLDLFAASSALIDQGVSHRLLVVGGTPDEGPAAEAEVRALAPSHAELVGTRGHADMPDVYASGDVFCLPSWWEAMPLSVLEAMAAALPVVVTDVGEVRRLVEDGVSGRVVAPRDRGALTAALGELLRDPALRGRMGTAGRERAVSSFSLERTVDAVDELYRALSR